MPGAIQKRAADFFTRHLAATAAGFGESDIRLWDAASGKEIGRLQGHTAWVGSLVFWPDGKKLASASGDQTIRTWDVPSRTCTDVLRGHRLEVWRLALLPDNRTLVSGSKDGTVCLWDTSVTHPRREYITWTEKIFAWSFAPDSQSILTVNPDGQLARWSGSDFQYKEPLLETGIKGTANQDDVFSPDGRFLASHSPDRNISVWDISRRALSLAFKPATGRTFPQTFLAQGSRLVVWSEADNRLIEWDLAANRQIQSWAAPAEFRNGAVSPDEQQLVAAGYEGDFSVRNLAEQSTRNTHLDILETSGLWTFAPSGKLVAAGSYLGYARVWDTGSWKEVATLGGFRGSVNSVTFSPDGNRLATSEGARHEAIKIWAVDSWQDVLTLHAEAALFNDAIFSPDDNAIGVVTDEGTLRVWQAPSWDQIAAAEAKQKAENEQH